MQSTMETELHKSSLLHTAYLYRHVHMLELVDFHTKWYTVFHPPQLKDYVKHNKVEGWVEIELFNERGKNWAVRRLLNADTNSSSWMLDGKEVLKKKASIHVFSTSCTCLCMSPLHPPTFHVFFFLPYLTSCSSYSSLYTSLIDWWTNSSPTYPTGQQVPVFASGI